VSDWEVSPPDRPTPAHPPRHGGTGGHGWQDPSTGGAVGPSPDAANKRDPIKGLIPKRRTRGLHCRFTQIPGETPKDVLRTPLRLPALLGSMRDSIDYSGGFTDYQTVAAGMFSSVPPGGREARFLRTVDALETLTVYWSAPWLVEHGLHPKEVERAIDRMVESHRPVQMLLTMGTRRKSTPEVRMDVTIRGRTRELRGNEPDTRYITLTGITEWRDPTVGRRGKSNGRKKGVHLPHRHRLRNTDTLASLSMEYYGSYKYWRRIRDYNGIGHKIGAHAVIVYNTRFQTGHHIKIPKVDLPRRASGQHGSDWHDDPGRGRDADDWGGRSGDDED
jgi:hypothetical protein